MTRLWWFHSMSSDKMSTYTHAGSARLERSISWDDFYVFFLINWTFWGWQKREREIYFIYFQFLIFSSRNSWSNETMMERERFQHEPKKKENFFRPRLEPLERDASKSRNSFFFTAKIFLPFFSDALSNIKKLFFLLLHARPSSSASPCAFLLVIMKWIYGMIINKRARRGPLFGLSWTSKPVSWKEPPKSCTSFERDLIVCLIYFQLLANFQLFCVRLAQGRRRTQVRSAHRHTKAIIHARTVINVHLHSHHPSSCNLKSFPSCPGMAREKDQISSN